MTDVQDRIDRALKLIAVHEGGEVNHPDDPGGHTNLGVTQATLNAWRDSRGEPRISVSRLTHGEAKEIFVQEYFAPVRFEKLPEGLGYCIADFAIHSGPGRAVKTLQRVLGGLTVDGIMGAKTLGALRTADVAETIHGVCDRRMAFLKSLSTWGTFGRGWGRRLSEVRAASIQFWEGRAVSEPKESTEGRATGPDLGGAKADEPRSNIGETTTARLTMAQIATAAGGAWAAVTQLEGPVQIAVIVGAAVVASTALFVFRDRLRHWRAGVR